MSRKKREELERLLQQADYASREGSHDLARSLADRAVSLDRQSLAARMMKTDVALAAGDAATALIELSVAARLAPGDAGLAKRLAALLARWTLDDPTAIDPRGLLTALHAPGVDTQPIARAAFRHWSSGINEADARRGLRREQLSDPLLVAALSAGLVTDAKCERLLAMARRDLLLAGPDDLFRHRPLATFAMALAEQCWLNEHVWSVSPDETARLDALAAVTIETDDLRWSAVRLLLALYRPPQAIFDGSAAELARLKPSAWRDIVARRLAEHGEEQAIISTIPGSIGTDPVGRAVARQYESSPYPRWNRLHEARPGSLVDAIARYAGAGVAKWKSEPFDVLIAGTGTGQQALRATIGYGPAARVTAIDLSRASLAYAVRMARRHAVANITFRQADILDLPPPGRPYDIIECVGVLHHMADPFAGWRALLRQLAPGGLMYVGLYSATARHDITALRTSDPAWPGPDATDDAARAYRADLAARPADAPGGDLKRSQDFYSLSDFRDLILHAHERPLRLDEIADFLAKDGLKFLGFTLPREVEIHFADRFPGTRWPGRLADWAVYEQENPRTFDGMYCFWCRRADTGK